MHYGSSQIREELHQFINRAEERVLNLMHGMMKANSEKGNLTKEQEVDLGKRIARHKKGESKSYDRSSIQETAHLLSTPANTAHLIESIAQHKAGKILIGKIVPGRYGRGKGSIR